MDRQELIDRYAGRLRSMTLNGMPDDDYAIGLVGTIADADHPRYGGSAERLDRVAAVLEARQLVRAERTFLEVTAS